jgi:hypothetical protein
MMDVDNDDGNDEVIRELDVYVTDKLELYLAQFPLKPVYSDPPNVHSAKVKPKSNKFELSIPYPNNLQKSYDLPAHERFQKLQSSELSTTNSFAAAFIAEERFIITPISSIQQFRPSMSHLYSNPATKVETVELAEPDVDNNLEVEASDTIQQIQLKRKESERAKAARLQSYGYLKAQEEREAAIPAKVYLIGSDESNQKFTDLLQATYPTEDQTS